MQEFLDENEMHVKKIAKFDTAQEKQLNKLSVYEFLFHLVSVLDSQPD